MTTYVLAGGCFWCLDAVFRRINGVQASICGYAGGSAKDANYYAVATGDTGHAESIQLTFDESIIPKEIVLDIFFLIHNPTTKDRQGNDVGPQYRSALFYTNDAQKADFEAGAARAEQHRNDPVVTEITPLQAFYEAEPEHQNYFANHPENTYCAVVIDPKITKAKQAYAAWFTPGY